MGLILFDEFIDCFKDGFQTRREIPVTTLDGLVMHVLYLLLLGVNDAHAGEPGAGINANDAQHMSMIINVAFILCYRLY